MGMFRSDKARRSVNLRDIHGAGVFSAIAATVGSGQSGAAGRSLIAEYENDGNQTITLASDAYTNARINAEEPITASPLVTSEAPFELTSDEDRNFWIEARVVFEPSSDSERYVLAIAAGEASSLGDAGHSFRAIQRGVEREMFAQCVVSMRFQDVLYIDFRAFNSGSAAQDVVVTGVNIRVYSA